MSTALNDTNAIVAALLQDMAAMQAVKEKATAYRRAADAIFTLDAPLPALRDLSGCLPKIPAVGASSLAIIEQWLASGRSSTVDHALQQSPKYDDVMRRRALREGYFSRSAVLDILSAADRRTRPSLRGDLQMHSTGSDGRDPIEALAAGALARGYDYLAVTDHAHGLAIAGGMSMPAFRAQHHAIDQINEACGGNFRVIKGVEANITADGSIDLQTDERSEFEIVLAAPHAQLRSTTDQTARLVRAVEHTGVHVLAHPSGRQLGTRGGLVVNWPRVFRAAAQANVAVEIDGDPHRQDLRWDLARQAIDAGCLIALDSDAHAAEELAFADTAVAHAVLAEIPPGRIINTWSTAKLLAWLKDR